MVETGRNCHEATRRLPSALPAAVHAPPSAASWRPAAAYRLPLHCFKGALGSSCSHHGFVGAHHVGGGFAVGAWLLLPKTQQAMAPRFAPLPAYRQLLETATQATAMQ